MDRPAHPTSWEYGHTTLTKQRVCDISPWTYGTSVLAQALPRPSQQRQQCSSPTKYPVVRARNPPRRQPHMDVAKARRSPNVSRKSDQHSGPDRGHSPPGTTVSFPIVHAHHSPIDGSSVNATSDTDLLAQLRGLAPLNSTRHARYHPEWHIRKSQLLRYPDSCPQRLPSPFGTTSRLLLIACICPFSVEDLKSSTSAARIRSRQHGTTVHCISREIVQSIATTTFRRRADQIRKVAEETHRSPDAQQPVDLLYSVLAQLAQAWANPDRSDTANEALTSTPKVRQ